MKKKTILSSIDIGKWAAHYADNTFGYGHFKHEVYPLYADILATLPKKARVLDIGAGPGNMTRFYSKTFSRRPLAWTLIDASDELLKIAAAKGPKGIRTFVRSYNLPNWDKGLGKFAAIISNNSLFHVRPRGLTAFYRVCAAHLKKHGFMLNQQSFAYEGAIPPHADRPFERFMAERIPAGVMPPNPLLLDAKKKTARNKAKRKALEQHRAALEKAAADGLQVKGGQTGYNFLTVEKHLAAMRRAGLQAGCIWRKREFAVICGVKG